jgi:hypothetical protein
MFWLNITKWEPKITQNSAQRILSSDLIFFYFTKVAQTFDFHT